MFITILYKEQNYYIKLRITYFHHFHQFVGEENLSKKLNLK